MRSSFTVLLMNCRRARRYSKPTLGGERLSSTQYRPGDPGQLVGDCHDCDIAMAVAQQTFGPPAKRGVPPLESHGSASCADICCSTTVPRSFALGRELLQVLLISAFRAPASWWIRNSEHETRCVVSQFTFGLRLSGESVREFRDG
jgi:hypothetical protein